MNVSKEKLLELLKYQLNKIIDEDGRQYALIVLTREEAEAIITYLENNLDN